MDSDGGATVNVIFATSEVAPFSKTGGLADVSGSLPGALARLGHQVTVVTPAYRQVKQLGLPTETLDIELEISISSKVVTGRLLRCQLPDSGVSVILVEQDDYFDRDQLYQKDGQDYNDNCERFVFYCRAVMELIRSLEQPVDVIHCNDWQTGLLPALLRIEYEHARGCNDIVTVMTIHNMAYQGQFWHWDMLLTGLDWKYFNWRQMEFWGNLNLLKTGLTFADAVTAVSPRYAEEIQSQPMGCGLEGVLQQRRHDITGIINGVDYSIWNPETDPHLAANYNASNWQTGKAACKAALQRELGLTESPQTPLLGFVGRLADQKGLDLLASVMQKWSGEERDVQWAILGTGDPRYHELLSNLAAEHAGKIGVSLAFSDALAHRIEAGADMFLMPSRFEPCGLNQLYSLKYGSLPVVRETGGLADTVCDADEAAIAAETANGFSFFDYEPPALEEALTRAVAMYREHPETWRRVVGFAMRQDWSWEASAGKYADLYASLAARRANSRENIGETS
jgi:starch synthase